METGILVGHVPGTVLRVKRISYIHKSGDRVDLKGKETVRIITRQEWSEGRYMYKGKPLSQKTKNMLTRLASPKNQEIYFWEPDIL